MYIGGNYYGRRLRGYECDNYYGHFDSNISVSNIRPTSSAVRIVRSTGHTAGSRPIYDYRLYYTVQGQQLSPGVTYYVAVYYLSGGTVVRSDLYPITVR